MSLDNTTRLARIAAGVAEARKHGRGPGAPRKVSDAVIRAAMPLGTTVGARKVGLSKVWFIARRKVIERGEASVVNGRLTPVSLQPSRAEIEAAAKAVAKLFNTEHDGDENVRHSISGELLWKALIPHATAALHAARRVTHGR